jgi:hypothetical protein
MLILFSIQDNSPKELNFQKYNDRSNNYKVYYKLYTDLILYFFISSLAKPVKLVDYDISALFT